MGTSDPFFSILVVSYNSAETIAAVLASLKDQSDQDFEVLILDNASTDETIAEIETARIDRLKLEASATNLGFAEGNNRLAAKARGTWVALLNPDAVARPDWLANVRLAIARHPACDSFASAQLQLRDPDTLDGAGDCYLWAGIPWRGGYGRPASEMPGEGECFSPCGAGSIYRRETFLDLGGFDEAFFCYCEDVDLGYRLRLTGGQCIFVPDAVIEHAGGGSSGGGASAFSLFHGTRNRLWTYVGNTPALLFWASLPAHLAITAAILIRGLFTGRFADSWRGLIAGLDGLGPYWARRKRLGKLKGSAHVLRYMSLSPIRMLMRKTDIKPLKRR
jgi:N-acetylglucosaminyl-diphospho-decaprenol L-rhamnosyltransferase